MKNKDGKTHGQINIAFIAKTFEFCQNFEPLRGCLSYSPFAVQRKQKI